MSGFFPAAVRQAVASTRVRFKRQMITAAGIGLSIAFYSGIRTAGSAMGDPARLNWMTGLSLLMCLVGVTNSMLMSVAERYREIGTFKCLGASDGFIVTVFILEALMLGTIGSAFGALLGSAAAGWSQGQPIRFDVILAAIGIGVCLTLVAAIIPAAQAAKMPAAAALRSEA